MTQYLIRRLLQGILTLLAITVIVFLLASAYPGGIMNAYEENPDATAADLARLRAKYGLDEPLPVRYFKWLGNVARGDFGTAVDRTRSLLVATACHLFFTFTEISTGRDRQLLLGALIPMVVFLVHFWPRSAASVETAGPRAQSIDA